jgi:hypothetical protein
MFGKKVKCVCGKKIDASYAYCPHCGADLKAKAERDEEVDDMMKQVEDAMNMPFFLKLPFEKLVKQMTSEIEKQFKEYDKMLPETEKQDKPNIISSGLSINISSSSEGEPVIQIKQLGDGAKIREKKEEKEASLPVIKLDEKDAKRMAKLPREEPETKVRRLTDKIIYEILLPGVKNEKDIMINKLQNSIEIKAFAKDKAYFKLIPVSLPIKKYHLDKDKLILELKP